MVVSERDDVRHGKIGKINLAVRFLNNFTSKHSRWITGCGRASVFPLPVDCHVFVVTGLTGAINKNHRIIPLVPVVTRAIFLLSILRPKLCRPPPSNRDAQTALYDCEKELF